MVNLKYLIFYSKENTLTNKDKLNLESLISENRNFNKIKNFEGIRGLILEKEKKVNFGGFKLKNLLLSGVGYYDSLEGNFFRPSKENFYNKFKNMGTSYVRDNKYYELKENFAPFGSYLESNLLKKVKNTEFISTYNFKNFKPIKLEGYGFYNEEELSYNGERFGFLFFSIPTYERFSNSLLKLLNKDIKKLIINKNSLLNKGINKIAKTLRELHDNNLVHLQPHFSNFYYDKNLDKVYLCDFTTLKKTDNITIEDKFANEVIDISVVQNSIMKLFNNPELSFYLLGNFLLSYFNISQEEYLNSINEIRNNWYFSKNKINQFPKGYSYDNNPIFDKFKRNDDIDDVNVFYNLMFKLKEH